MENPAFLYAATAPTVTSFHSAAWTWDGSILVTGWEPGGGTAPRCQATGAPISPPTAGSSVQTDEMKTVFFHDGATGAIIGRHVLPRPHSEWENCTIHNYNIVPHPTRTSSSTARTKRGLYVWNVSAPEARGPTVKPDHHPQTNQLSLGVSRAVARRRFGMAD